MNDSFNISFETFCLMSASKQKHYFELLTKSNNALKERVLSLSNHDCSNCKHDTPNSRICKEGIERPYLETLSSVQDNIAEEHNQNCQNHYCCGIFWESKV